MCHRYRAITLIWSPVIYLFFMMIPLDHQQLSARQQTTLRFNASDYYLDYTKSVYEVVIMFLTQCSLLGFYLLGLYTDGTPKFSNGRVFAFYYAGASLRAHIAHRSYIHLHMCMRMHMHTCMSMCAFAHVHCMYNPSHDSLILLRLCHPTGHHIQQQHQGRDDCPTKIRAILKSLHGSTTKGYKVPSTKCQGRVSSSYLAY